MKKTKYYYNGQLIRTSTNDNYNYALLFVNKDFNYKCYKCSSKYDACLKELTYITKGETLAKQYGITIAEAFKKFPLWSSQLEEAKNFIIVKLERR